MFNVIVCDAGWETGRFEFWQERIFEYTLDAVKARFRNIEPDYDALRELPTLFMNEGVGNEIARLGTVTNVFPATKGTIRVECRFDPGVPEFQNRHLVDLATDLSLHDFEFSRNHWAVKDGDLCRILLQSGLRRRVGPRMFQIPEHENVEVDLVSVMMPFDAAFNPVFTALQNLCGETNLRCQRADSIWDHDVVIDDVVSLIDRSSVVIADCTGRNANVFYEIGIAHTLGRDVIIIAQNRGDIPFDLQHRRYVQYHPNGEGLTALVGALRERLQRLAGR